MTMPVAGNAVVVNFLMRFPVLIPVVAAVVVTTAVLPAAPTPTPTPTPPIVEKKVDADPAPPVIVAPKSIEVLCPPIEKTVKLHAREKQALRAKGCKVKG